jgi:signal transduction histidine kinase
MTELDDLVALARELCGSAVAEVHQATAHEERTLASTDPEASAHPLDESLCAQLTEPGLVVVPDTTLDPRFADHPGITTGTTKVRFHASAAVTAPDGALLGRLCVADPEPAELSQGQARGLLTLADRVADVLEPAGRTRALAEVEGRLADARADLERAHEELRLFAGQVSHDLRTPLTAVLANAEMLATEPVVAESEDAQWMADGIVRAVQRMDAMIEEMLRYARDNGELALGVTSLGEVAQQALDDLAPMVHSTGAQVTLDPLPTVAADAHRIYGVLRNLLANAMKFARAEVPPQIRVSAGRRGGTWRVSVTDNGIGVAPARRDAMFVLFTRADKRIEGAGLGLATAKRAVEAHGGRMGMDDGVDGGTTVWFELPA